MYDDGTPYRMLHPDEFELAEAGAPVLLYDAAQQAFPFYLGDEYYESYDNAAYYEDVAPHGDPGAGSSQDKAKKKRKRKPRKGKEK